MKKKMYFQIKKFMYNISQNNDFTQRVLQIGTKIFGFFQYDLER